MVTLLCTLLLAAAQPPAPAPQDPFLRQLAETRGFRAGRPTLVTVAPDGRHALFLRSGPRAAVQSLFETDLRTGETRELLSPAALLGGAQAPTAEEAARLERQRILARGITHYTTSPDGRRIAFAIGGRLWLLERATGKAAPVAGAEGVLDPRFAPDGRALAFVKDRDLFVLELASGRTRRVTHARAASVSNGLAEFVAQEEMGRQEGYWWAPDGRRLAYAEVDEAPVQHLALCDPARPERGCEEVAYPRAGTANAAVRLAVVPASGGRPVFVRWDREAFPYLATVRWEKGGPLALVVQNRAQTELRLLAADPATGATRVLLAEHDDAWVELFQEFPRFRGDGSFYWVTERNGGPEVELRGADGAARGSVVPKEAGFVDLAGYDRDEDELVYTAAPDPTRTVVQRVRRGGPPETIALGEDGPALARAVAAEKGGAVAVTWTTLTRTARTAVFARGGARLAELPSVAEEPPFASTTELRRVGAGEGLWTAVLRPRGAAPGARLPVVVDVYGGPSGPRAVNAPMIAEQWLADQGFVVVRIDGRGTTGRGRAFSRAVKGDFSEIVLDDQVAGLRALAAEVPAMDLGRVGITGWSFGGYASALAVLRRPEVFHAAVAGAPVAEWRDYDTHYTERYLGSPDENRAGYDASSLLTWAPGLSRPLLVLHGTADDNVFFSHALKLGNALFRAGRRFELLPVAGATHMIPEPTAVVRRWEETAGFLRLHLAASAARTTAAAP
ncbi:DPP IV N-terminal domain-containing protein [Anaeromyxobacter terrae]|uniref:DPP IV N-terminal domain-containing protein n=1 Tax=Anaeromyxobacter terrae TaxID=2925406 RepID=UPI001F5A6F7B|nr:DPP IV N-terminal domain-containing protein [Anaeromyxobacter sp. SG22]